MRGIVAQNIIIFIIGIVFTIIFISNSFKYFTNKGVSSQPEGTITKADVNVIKRISIGARILMICFILFWWIYFALPVLLDLPSIISNRYDSVKGVVNRIEYTSKGDEVLYITSNNSQIVLTVSDRSVKQGDIVTVSYLKHLKTGEVQSAED